MVTNEHMSSLFIGVIRLTRMQLKARVNNILISLQEHEQTNLEPDV